MIPDAEFKQLNQLDKHRRFNLPFDWAVDIFGEVGQENIEKQARDAVAKA